MQTLTEVVATTSGRTVTVTTSRNYNESIDEFIQRHNATVDAVKAL